MLINRKDAVQLNEELFEETASSLINSTWPRIRARVKSQNIHASYVGVGANGDLLFSTNSGTTPGQRWNTRIRFKDLDTVQKFFSFSRILRKKRTLKMLLDGDILVDCNCPCYAYYCKYVAWSNGYGIHTETRRPVLRNPKEDKIVCKHIIASLILLADMRESLYKEYVTKGILTRKGERNEDNIRSRRKKKSS